MILFTYFLLFSIAEVHAQSPILKEFETKKDRVALVELFTSEGCSFCPPAEKKLSRLRESKQLWQSWVPVAYHVDYWDHLGWIDPFSNKQFTMRQRAYARNWEQHQVYTPNFVINGKEWKEWGKSKKFPKHRSKFPGTLKIIVYRGYKIQVKFWPAVQKIKEWKFEAALLANKFKIPIKKGENRGQTLEHDFVALNLVRKKSKLQGEIATANFDLSNFKQNRFLSQSKSIAAWVIPSGSLIPIQAIGGDL